MKSCLPDEIPFGAVVSVINRGRSVFLNNRLRQLHLSAGQFPVMMLLAREQDIIQEDLVRHYHLDKGTIARAVKKLEDGGYVRRITDSENRRAVRLFLTEKGEHAVPFLRKIYREWEYQISAGLSHDEVKTIQTLMHRVAENSFSILENDGGSLNAGE